MKAASRERIALLFAAFVIGWLVLVLVHVENQRYALLVGMCTDRRTGIHDSECLRSVETRTGWWWHVFYAVKEFGYLK
jgi:hypothetical protein